MRNRPPLDAKTESWLVWAASLDPGKQWTLFKRVIADFRRLTIDPDPSRAAALIRDDGTVDYAVLTRVYGQNLPATWKKSAIAQGYEEKTLECMERNWLRAVLERLRAHVAPATRRYRWNKALRDPGLNLNAWIHHERLINATRPPEP